MGKYFRVFGLVYYNGRVVTMGGHYIKYILCIKDFNIVQNLLNFLSQKILSLKYITFSFTFEILIPSFFKFWFNFIKILTLATSFDDSITAIGLESTLGSSILIVLSVEQVITEPRECWIPVTFWEWPVEKV